MKTKHTKIYTRLATEPYRLLFMLGLAMGLIGVGHWLVPLVNDKAFYSAFFHSSVQSQAYLGCFVFGFLMTMLPRMRTAALSTGREVLVAFLLPVLIAVFHAFQLIVPAQIAYILWLLAFIVFAFKRFRAGAGKTKAKPPAEFIWIPVGLFCGILGTAFLLLAGTDVGSGHLIRIGKPMVEQGFILSIVLGIGGFLGPRLMGIKEIIHPQGKGPGTDPDRRFRRGLAFNGLAAAVVFGSFFLDRDGPSQTGYFLRACVVTVAFVRVRVWPKLPVAKEFFVKLLWISIWMVLLGHWGAAIFWSYRVAMLHIVFIGGYSLMIFSIATMVILSHAGEAPKLRGRLWILWVVALAVGAAVSYRVASSFFPEQYFDFLHIAASLWIAAGLGWLTYVIPKIFRAPEGVDLEKLHEEARHRLRDNNSSPEGGAC